MPVLALSSDRPLERWPHAGSLAIVDLEYTAWDGSAARGWSGADEWREIVQIGALLTDAGNFAPRAGLERLVRPVRNPALSDYFQALTGITQADVDAQGRPFAQAVSELQEFLAGAECVIFNGCDGQILRENCEFHGIACRLPLDRMFDFRALLARSLAQPASVLVSSQLPALAGIEVNGRAHSALHDCRAIARALAHWRASDLL